MMNDLHDNHLPTIEALEESPETEASSALPLPKGLALVAKHDVYGMDNSLLLLKAGEAVNGNLLPQLLRFGATPEQFALKAIETTPKEVSPSFLDLLQKGLSPWFWNRAKKQALSSESYLGRLQLEEQQKPSELKEPLLATPALLPAVPPAHSLEALSGSFTPFSKGLATAVTLPTIVVFTSNLLQAEQLTTSIQGVKPRHAALKKQGSTVSASNKKVITCKTLERLTKSLNETTVSHVIIDFYSASIQHSGFSNGLSLLKHLKKVHPNVVFVLWLRWPSAITAQQKQQLQHWFTRHQAYVLEKPTKPEVLHAILNTSATAEHEQQASF